MRNIKMNPLALIAMAAGMGGFHYPREIQFNLNRENSAALDSANQKIKAAQERNRLNKETRRIKKNQELNEKYF